MTDEEAELALALELLAAALARFRDLVPQPMPVRIPFALLGVLLLAFLPANSSWCTGGEAGVGLARISQTC